MVGTAVIKAILSLLKKHGMSKGAQAAKQMGFSNAQISKALRQKQMQESLMRRKMQPTLPKLPKPMKEGKRRVEKPVGYRKDDKGGLGDHVEGSRGSAHDDWGVPGIDW